MKISIRIKMITGVCLISLITLVLSGSCAYFYFTGLLTDQSIKDDKIKVNQIAHQLTYLSDEILKFSYNIMIDQKVQDFLKTTYYEEAYDQIENRTETIKRLGDYIVLRDYINSITIIAPDGNVYWNIAPEDDYFKNKLSEKWYVDYKKSKLNHMFSTRHEIDYQNSKVSVISYITKLKNIEEPQKIIGELILNIKLDWIRNFIKQGGEDFDGFMCLGNENEVLYNKNDNKFNTAMMKFSSTVPAGYKGNDRIQENKEGYMIVDNSIGNGWRLVSFTSKSRLFERVNFVFYFFLILVSICMILAAAAIFPLIINVTRPITQLSKAMKKVSKGELDTRVRINSRDELETLGDGFNLMVRDLNEYINKSLENEKVKKNMEFGMLLSQINPHFIYNTLNSVIYYARKQGNNDIVRLMSSFIKILQDAVKVGEEGAFATLEKEIEVLEHYITIQKYRYYDRFDVYYNIDERLKKCTVPRTLIQPLVENALIHGVLLKDTKGYVEVTIAESADVMKIIVEDNGVGMEQEAIDVLMEEKQTLNISGRMRSIGIPNIRGRIRFLYGDQYGVKIESKPGEWTRIIVLLPIDDTYL